MAVARSGNSHLSAKPVFLEKSKSEQEVGRRTVVTSPHGEQDLANIHTSNGSVGLTPRTTHSSLQSIGTRTRQHFVDADNVVRVGADTEVETFFAGDFDEISVGQILSKSAGVDGNQWRMGWIGTYLLAQMRAASRASEDSCSYSLETMWTQRGNSSTLARLRPRSKMRILGSGTPRLKRDLGYGCKKIWSKQFFRTIADDFLRGLRYRQCPSPTKGTLCVFSKSALTLFLQ